MSTPTVFISYSHCDENWKNRLIRHLYVLQLEGQLDLWDDRRIGAGEEWRDEIAMAMTRAQVAVLLISADFLTSRFIRHTEIPRLLQRRTEEGLQIVPIIVHPCLWQKVPWLAKLQCRPRDGRALSKGSRAKVEEDLTTVATEILHLLSSETEDTPEFRRNPLLDIGRLPIPGPYLFGREAELALLDAAWQDPSTHVLTLVAFGGVGKSALIHHWMDRMGAAGWRGATRVLDWSFYSQGTDDRVTSAELFIDHALRFFGDSSSSPKAMSAHDRGARLAALIREQRSLVVLDGIEPLQYGRGIPQIEGRLKDPGLRALLKGLAAGNRGLCVVTTRERIGDLDGFPSAAPQITLEELKSDAAIELLRRLGVVGNERELITVVEKFRHHALTLNLLGNFVRRAQGGDVRKTSAIDLPRADAKQGGQAFRIIAAYSRWLGDGPELAILRLLGFFDRPASSGALKALRVAPGIPGLTDSLVGLTTETWRFAIAALREHNLLAPANPREPDALDTHPIVRAYFAYELENHHPVAWREGHRRLYEYLRQSTSDLPDTLQAAEPLYAAIIHGCRAGQHAEALTELYKRRIARGGENFSWTKLAAFGSELTALAAFFDQRWEQPSTRLTLDDRAYILNKVAFVLWALGHLEDAREPLEAGLHAYIAQEKWKEAALSADDLSKLMLNLGEIERSQAIGKQSVEFADRSGDAFHKMTSRATWAHALHQAGRLDESARVFREAETIQVKRQPRYPRLYLLQGCRYCDLLLSLAEPKDGSGLDGVMRLAPEDAEQFRLACAEVLDRVRQLLEWRAERDSILAVALEELVLGRVQLALALVATARDTKIVSLSTAHAQLSRAVDGMRRSGQESQLPHGLLARAACRRLCGGLVGAAADIEEAFQIADRGVMRLHQCDAHIEAARLSRDQGQILKAREHLARARELVKAIGYRRREREVAYLEAELATSQ